MQATEDEISIPSLIDAAFDLRYLEALMAESFKTAQILPSWPCHRSLGS